MVTVSIETVREVANSTGLHLCSAISNFNLEDHATHLQSWQARGFAGEMKYMYRPPDLLSNPKVLLPDLESIIMFAVPYEAAPPEPCPTNYGRVARYAWGMDYHHVLREKMHSFLARLREVTNLDGLQARVFTDAVPLLEKALGANAGLGFIGKNTLLIRPKTGSYFFLCEVLLNVKVDGAEEMYLRGSSARGCGGCERCITYCPTDALVGPKVLDSRRCISYLTIEKRGPLTWSEREALGNWIFGCDICQEVCPFNHSTQKKSTKPQISEFSKLAGAGPSLSIEHLIAIKTNGEFGRLFKGTALLRAKREGLIRNAVVVAGNTGCAELFEKISELCTTDPSPVVRTHALWSLSKLALNNERSMTRRVRRIAEAFGAGTEESVKTEGNLILAMLDNSS